MASLPSLKLPKYPSSPTAPDLASPSARRTFNPPAAAPPLASENGAASRLHSPPLRIAYQGAPGAYSEFAAKTALPNSSPLPCRSFSDAIAAVHGGAADRVILPVESTLEGTALRNYDLLIQHDLSIVQEISLFVNYCLLAMPGVRKAELRRVISHPMALAHCGRAISDLGLRREPVEDTAGALKILLSNRLLDTAAIASPRAAALYGFDVLAQGLQDESWNVTRFLILEAPDKISKPKQVSISMTTSNVKTSMVVAYLGGSMMVLLKVLSAFSSRNINLTKLEVNNPTMEGGKGPVMVLDVGSGGCLRAFPHVLYVDFEGSTVDSRVKEAIEEIAGFSVMVRVLGSYAADTKIYDLY